MDILEQQTMESQEAPPESGGDATGGLIPYKNKHALVGYYMSIGGLLLMCVPVLGLGYGIAVLYCGIKGRKTPKSIPKSKAVCTRGSPSLVEWSKSWWAPLRPSYSLFLYWKACNAPDL